MSLVDLRGMRLLVMGGASGIGASCTDLALGAGANVAVSHLPGETPTTSHAFVCDVTDAGAVTAVVDKARAALGGLDAVILTAGIFDHRGVEETSDDDWARIVALNLTGPFHVARAVAPHFREAGTGSLVLFSSQIGLVGHRRATGYAATKGGVNGLTRTLAIEFAAFGARCNAVAPGPIETPMTAVARADADRARKLVEAVPLGRFGQPDEIARAALFLAAPASSFITGHILVADGGVTAI